MDVTDKNNYDDGDITYLCTLILDNDEDWKKDPSN